MYWVDTDKAEPFFFFIHKHAVFCSSAEHLQRYVSNVLRRMGLVSRQHVFKRYHILNT